MHEYKPRFLEKDLIKALGRAPVVAVLGPRQCGKSTLVRHLMEGKRSVYLDLQNRADRNKLNEPELFFERHADQCVCLDEIQLVPDLFSVLRSVVDQVRRPGRFLVLGSASRDLIRQSSETLAGRIAYLELTPFSFEEIHNECPLVDHWNRGGFPESCLAADDESSADWRRNFIRTFLERDIPDLGPAGIPVPLMERLWHHIAHLHGQTVNFSRLSEGMGVAVPTLKGYLSLLEQTFMIRLMPPFEANLKKRMVKSPKIYVRDSGLLHSLLDLETLDDVQSHPVWGASWEGYVIENLCTAFPKHRAGFLRTGNGAEADLVLEHRGERILVECKASKAPRASRGLHELIGDLRPARTFLVAPVVESYPYNEDIEVAPPGRLLEIMRTPE
jgi:predicted AAA+ superfamily ATPase